MQLIQTLNPENVTAQEIAKFEIRTAVRAVVFDQKGNVGLINVTKLNYHKLPGGGVEPGEDLLTALKRECREELGCEIEVTAELGEIIEYRKIFNLTQNSPGFAAKVVGEKGKPAYTAEEADRGFEILWVSLPEALKFLASDQPQDLEAKLYIVPREKIFLSLLTELNQ